MKKVLLGVAAVLVVLVGAVVALLVATFAGTRPLTAEASLPGGAWGVMDGTVAAFVLPAGDKEVALIDCGNDLEAAAVLESLASKGLSPSAVKVILLTHGHPDHVAGCSKFPTAQVLVLGGDVALASGLEAGKGPLPRLLGTSTEKRAKISRQLSDGEAVQVGPLTVRVYAIPGHTAGSAAYLAGGVLYLGDSAMGTSDGKVRGAPWLFSDDTEQNLTSLRALARRLREEHQEVRVLAFSHTGAVDGLGPLEALGAQ